MFIYIIFKAWNVYSISRESHLLVSFATGTVSRRQHPFINSENLWSQKRKSVKLFQILEIIKKLKIRKLPKKWWTEIYSPMHSSQITRKHLIKKIFLAGLIFYFLVLGKLLFRRKISQLWQTLLGALFQISENIMIWITNNT